MAKKHTAGCACGAVRFEFDTDPDFIAVCHCLDCKKASGGEAATWFGVPADDDRFQVVCDDGAAFVARSPGAFDVLLLDAFDASGLPPQLSSQVFYDACFDALVPGGLLVVNLHADDAGHDAAVQRIARGFDGNAMQVLAVEKSNCIVFAGRELAVTLEALRGLGWAGALDSQVKRQLRAEFAHIGWNALKIPRAAAPRP